MVGAVALSFAAIFAWRMFIAPMPAEEPAIETAPGVEQQLAEPVSEEPPSLQEKVPPPASDTPAEAVEGDVGAAPIEVVTPGMELLFSPRGARLLSLKLPGYPEDTSVQTGSVVDLVSPEARREDLLPLSISLPEESLAQRINEAWFLSEEADLTEEELEAVGMPPEARRIDFRWADGAGLDVEKRVWLPSNGNYLLRVEWSVTNRGVPVDGARITWGPSLGRPSESSDGNRYAYRGHAIVSGLGGVERYRPDNLDADLVFDATSPARWLALDSQYFAVALVPETPAAGAVRRVPVQGVEADPALLIETADSPLSVFAGPKSDSLLHEVEARIDADLTGLVDWGFFGFLARPLYIALDFIHGLVGNWGWAIVLLTLIIKLCFYPLTQRAMVNMRRTQEKMGRLQPRMRKIKEKYRDKKDMESRRKMQEDMMALYKTEGVNPMAPVAGCLPLLLQLPVLYGMYTLLTVALELRGAPFFGWIRDLSAYDPFFVTPIVMGVTMLAQQLMSLTKVEDPQQKAQQRMMLFMPVMFTFFFIRLPSGLVLYWLTNNVLGIAQQVVINRQAAAATEAEKTASSGKPSGSGRSK
jgi:YidC/Oxa1 family membrane protein insertase